MVGPDCGVGSADHVRKKTYDTEEGLLKALDNKKTLNKIFSG